MDATRLWCLQLTFVRYLLRAYQFKATLFAPATLLGAEQQSANFTPGDATPPKVYETFRKMATHGHEIGLFVHQLGRENVASHAITLKVAAESLLDAVGISYMPSLSYGEGVEVCMTLQCGFRFLHSAVKGPIYEPGYR